MLPILMANTGDCVKVVRVGGRPDVKKHLEDLGFVPDTEVNIIQSTGGNMIIKVKDSKLAITKEMAEKIMVQ